MDSELAVVEVELDRLARSLFVVLRPVDSELAVVEVDVDRLVTLLFVVLRPVDSELTAVEVDVDRLMTCCSSCSGPSTANCTAVEVDVDRLRDVAVGRAQARRQRACTVDDVRVDRLVDSSLFGVLRPVDSELTPVDSELAASRWSSTGCDDGCWSCSDPWTGSSRPLTASWPSSRSSSTGS